MSDLGSIPTPDEVRTELNKIRNSPNLKTKKKPMEVLAFVVERKLEGGDGVEIDQKDIARAVWPNKKFALDTFLAESAREVAGFRNITASIGQQKDGRLRQPWRRFGRP